uniref:Uncharacterized protein n=1 Tax=Arundo donax TaxID=35708 RepID=A0A0A9D860_ARUDO
MTKRTNLKEGSSVTLRWTGGVMWGRDEVTNWRGQRRSVA